MQGHANQQPQVVTGHSTSGQPVIVYVVNQSSIGCSAKHTNYNGKLAAIFGGLQIVLGVVSVALHASALGIGNFYNRPWVYYTGHGIWSPVFWFIAGGFGLASAAAKTRCTIITTMVMSIISAVTIIPFLTFQSLAVEETSDDYEYDYDYISEENENVEKVFLGCSIVLLIACVAEGIIAIAASVICCKAVCCCNTIDNATANVLTQAMPLHNIVSTNVTTASGPLYVQQGQGTEKNGLVGHVVVPANGDFPEQPPAYSM